MGTCQGRPIEELQQQNDVAGGEVVVENNNNSSSKPRPKEKTKNKYAKATDLLEGNSRILSMRLKALQSLLAGNGVGKDESEDGSINKAEQQSLRKSPVKKTAIVDKKMQEEMNAMQSTIKSSSLSKTKASGFRDSPSKSKRMESPRLYNGKAVPHNTGIDPGPKNNARQLRKEYFNKTQKTLTSKIIYSNNNLLEIDQLLKQEIMNSNDPDQIIFEGKLLKYKPGTSFNWIERWVRVTRTELQYYKNQWTAACKDMKPLFVIPLRQLVAVFRVNLDLPELNSYNKWAKQVSSVQKKYNELFQLEIFTEQSEYPYKDEVYENDSEQLPEDQEEKGVKLAVDIDLDQMHGYSLWNEYQDRKLNESPENAREKGYLMRPPHKYRHLRGSLGGGGPENGPRQTRGASVDAGINRESILRGRVASLEIERCLDSISKKLCKYIFDEKLRLTFIFIRSPPLTNRKAGPNKKSAVYKWIKQTQMLTSWSGREREWFYSEKRLLFATPNEREREVWISVLNWLFTYVVNEEEQYEMEGYDQQASNEDL